MQPRRTGQSAFTGAPRVLRRRARRPTGTPGELNGDRRNGDGAAAPAPHAPRIGAPAPGTLRVAPSPVSHPGVAPLRPREPGGVALFAADLRAGFLLVNEARYRALERVPGLPRDQANLATLVVTVLAAEAIHEKLGRLLSAPLPGMGDVALGGAAIREVMLGPAKPGLPDIPVFTSLAALAVAGRYLVPGLKQSGHAIRTVSHDVRRAFVRRYWRPRPRAAR